MRPDTYSARAPDRTHWPWLVVALITIYTSVLLSSLFSSEALLRDAIDRRLLADGTHSAAQVVDFPTPPLEDANVRIMQNLKYKFVQMWIWAKSQTDI